MMPLWDAYVYFFTGFAVGFTEFEMNIGLTVSSMGCHVNGLTAGAPAAEQGSKGILKR